MKYTQALRLNEQPDDIMEKLTRIVMGLGVTDTAWMRLAVAQVNFHKTRSQGVN